MRLSVLAATLAAASYSIHAQDLPGFEKKVTEFTLPNGLHFIVVERHEAPVVSFHTCVSAGSVNDPSGATGIAHMFEHMAFKGTETIGTRNWAEEKKALQDIEAAYDRLEAERNRWPKANSLEIQSLTLRLKQALEEADNVVEPNEFTRVIEENGGAGLNASTSVGSTDYYYSLPSNRIELWFLLESQRFLHPVFREFYKERDVVQEENRMRVESSPQGRLFQNFLAAAFEAHPYRNPPGGWPSDLPNLRVSDAKAFFDKYYGPSNLNIAIVGDVNPAEAKRLAERYFGPLPARPRPPRVTTADPPQAGPKTVVVDSASQPLAIVGYKRPDENDNDDLVFDVIGLILGSGRTGVLYRELVQDKQLSLAAEAAPTYPDGGYPSLFVFFLAPNLGHTVDENVKGLEDVLARFASNDLDLAALARAKTKARAGVIEQLDSNSGLASILTRYYSHYGDWRRLFTSIDKLNKVTALDVQRVAQKYFVEQGRTFAYSVVPPPGQAPTRKPASGGRR